MCRICGYLRTVLHFIKISTLGITFLFFTVLLIISFWAGLGLHCCAGFSLVAESEGYSLVEVHGFLIVAASLAVGHGLKGACC